MAGYGRCESTSITLGICLLSAQDHETKMYVAEMCESDTDLTGSVGLACLFTCAAVLHFFAICHFFVL